ncbi:MAG TPA: carbon monoxide dehydrogenase subunit G [Ktedonobacterales bacterium]|nr:carbon monoxide dehydrogenase subunit G [Ktedonobacterales bacterium]
MHFEGQQTINAPIAKVYAFFTDPDSVASVTPGFQSMEVISPTHFKPTVAVGVGAVKAKFVLDVTLEDLQPPNRVVAAARGNAAGSAAEVRGGMDLSEVSPTVTNLQYTADVNVMGTLAAVGARLMEGTAAKMIVKFFDGVRQKLESPAAAPAS